MYNYKDQLFNRCIVQNFIFITYILCTNITGTMLSLSTWYFVAVTWSSNTGLYLYINGDLDASEKGFASNNVIETNGVIVLGQVRRLTCIQDTLSSRATLGLPAECVVRAKVSCIQAFDMRGIPLISAHFQDHTTNNKFSIY